MTKERANEREIYLIPYNNKNDIYQRCYLSYNTTDNINSFDQSSIYSSLNNDHLCDVFYQREKVFICH